MVNKFKTLSTLAIFESAIQVFDVCLWPIDENTILSNYCENELLVVSNRYKQLPSQNGCNILQVLTEWDRFKSYSLPMLKSLMSINYFEVWKDIFTNVDVIRE